MNAHDDYQLVMPEEMARSMAGRLQQLRLMRDWKQSSLARRAGLSLASLRRFEQTGEISLNGLLRLAFGPLFGLFDDSLPDGWGLLLMDRHMRSRDIALDAVSPE